MTGHIRKRGKHSWEIKIDFGRDPFTGKRRTKYHSIKGDRKDAEVELRRLLREIDMEEYVEPSKLKVSEFLLRWLPHIQTQVSPKTYERYAEITNKHLIPLFGDHKLSKLRPMHVSTAWSNSLTNGRRDGKGGLSPLTIRHHHRVLKQAIAQAVRWQILAKNPVENVDPPRVTKKQLTILNQIETGQLLDALIHSPFYIPTFLAVTTGMRRGEVLALRWKNVDFDAMQINVVESLEQTRNGLRFKETKNTKSRHIIMPSVLANELRSHKISQAEELFKIGVRQDQDLTVACQYDGSPMNPEHLSREFPNHVVKARLPRIRFHDLRHTHASHLLMEGVHPKIAQERLGHSSITITQDLYSHLLPGIQKEAVDKLDISLRIAIQNSRS